MTYRPPLSSEQIAVLPVLQYGSQKHQDFIASLKSGYTRDFKEDTWYILDHGGYKTLNQARRWTTVPVVWELS